MSGATKEHRSGNYGQPSLSRLVEFGRNEERNGVGKNIAGIHFFVPSLSVSSSSSTLGGAGLRISPTPAPLRPAAAFFHQRHQQRDAPPRLGHGHRRDHRRRGAGRAKGHRRACPAPPLRSCAAAPRLPRRRDVRRGQPHGRGERKYPVRMTVGIGAKGKRARSGKGASPPPLFSIKKAIRGNRRRRGKKKKNSP